MPELRAVLIAAACLGFIAVVDPWSLPAAGLFGIACFFIGLSMGLDTAPGLPRWQRMLEAPVDGLRRRQPWTEPRFSDWGMA